MTRAIINDPRTIIPRLRTLPPPSLLTRQTSSAPITRAPVYHAKSQPSRAPARQPSLMACAAGAHTYIYTIPIRCATGEYCARTYVYVYAAVDLRYAARTRLCRELACPPRKRAPATPSCYGSAS